jgi:hypothetical protein
MGWAEVELVDGTAAMIWPAPDLDAAESEELPDPSTGVEAVLSRVKSNVVRFELATDEPLADVLLVSTVAVSGPARFIVGKSYQAGAALVCDSPDEVYVIERRDLFRIPVAAPVTIHATSGHWSLFTMDCSLGGLCVCPPLPLAVATEVRVKLTLDGAMVLLSAVVRHTRPVDGGGDPNFSKLAGGAAPSVTGLQFVEVRGDTERQLSDFIGRHQRRLMPRVQAVVPLEYRSHGLKQFVEGRTHELSPGDIVFVVRQRHLPGDRVELKARLSRQEYIFNGSVVNSRDSDDGGVPLHVVKVSLDDAGSVIEGQFRKAVRDLAIDRIGSRRA